MYKTLHKRQDSVTVQLRFARSSVTFCAPRDRKIVIYLWHGNKEHAGYPKFKSKYDNHKSYTTNFTNGNIKTPFYSFFRCFACRPAAFCAVWGGRPKGEPPLANFKLHAARARVCVCQEPALKQIQQLRTQGKLKESQ